MSDRFDAIPKVEEATWLGDEERRALRASFEREIATIATDD